MSFKRRTMEEVVERMIGWARGTTSKLTDFRVGSKTRTLFEAVGVEIELLYDKVYRAIRKLIEENIYSVIGFDKEPATYSTGVARFSRTVLADMNYLVPTGTIVMSNPSDFQAPIRYRTIEDKILEIGQYYVDVQIICEEAGTRGNVGAGEINVFVNKPTGIDEVSNPTALTNGKDEETKEEQKARFNAFIEANARGILQSVEYGAKLAKLYSTDGTIVTEEVKQAVALEYSGYLEVYVWNGSGAASQKLKDLVLKIENGYYTEDGSAVYGYKPAGIPVTVYTAPMVPINLQLYIEPEDWTTLAAMKPLAEAAVDLYFGSLLMGQEFIQTALEANIKYIEGIRDCKLYISTDNGATYTTDNVSIERHQICTASKPITYL